jgi:hypothetical protein
MRKDAITGGRIILNYENNEVDLIIKNAMGATLSVKQQGGNIVVLPSSEGLIALSVFYKGPHRRDLRVSTRYPRQWRYGVDGNAHQGSH